VATARAIGIGKLGRLALALPNHVRFTPDSDRESGFPKKVCLLYPQKRTCALQLRMSAKGQKRTLARLIRDPLYEY
jgi:hypothetical protein